MEPSSFQQQNNIRDLEPLKEILKVNLEDYKESKEFSIPSEDSPIYTRWEATRQPVLQEIKNIESVIKYLNQEQSDYSNILTNMQFNTNEVLDKDQLDNIIDQIIEKNQVNVIVLDQIEANDTHALFRGVNVTNPRELLTVAIELSDTPINIQEGSYYKLEGSFATNFEYEKEGLKYFESSKILHLEESLDEKLKIDIFNNNQKPYFDKSKEDDGFQYDDTPIRFEKEAKDFVGQMPFSEEDKAGWINYIDMQNSFCIHLNQHEERDNPCHILTNFNRKELFHNIENEKIAMQPQNLSVIAVDQIEFHHTHWSFRGVNAKDNDQVLTVLIPAGSYDLGIKRGDAMLLEGNLEENSKRFNSSQILHIEHSNDIQLSKDIQNNNYKDYFEFLTSIKDGTYYKDYTTGAKEGIGHDHEGNVIYEEIVYSRDESKDYNPIRFQKDIFEQIEKMDISPEQKQQWKEYVEIQNDFCDKQDHYRHPEFPYAIVNTSINEILKDNHNPVIQQEKDSSIASTNKEIHLEGSSLVKDLEIYKAYFDKQAEAYKHDESKLHSIQLRISEINVFNDLLQDGNVTAKDMVQKFSGNRHSLDNKTLDKVLLDTISSIQERDYLRGRLGCDPEYKRNYFSKVATFTVGESINSGSGRIEWRNVQVNANLFSPEMKNMKHGDYVQLEGRYKLYRANDEFGSLKGEFITKEVVRYKEAPKIDTKETMVISGVVQDSPKLKELDTDHHIARMDLQIKDDKNNIQTISIQVWNKNVNIKELQQIKVGDTIEIQGGKAIPSGTKNQYDKEFVVQKVTVNYPEVKEKVEKSKGIKI